LELCYNTMKYKLLYILLILFFFSGCKDAEPDQRDLAIIRTQIPKDVDETGATFEAEIIVPGKSPATAYGFVWGIEDPTIENSDKISLAENLGSGKISYRIDHALAGGIKYKIRAFAMSENKIIYGNTISFMSKGSTHNGWSIVKSVLPYTSTWIGSNSVWETLSYGCSDNEFGYVLYNNAEMLRFDPSTNEFSRLNNYPVIGNEYTKFTAVVSGKTQYYFSNISAKLYRFQDGEWSIQSPIPFQYWRSNGYFQGLSVNNNIYILSPYVSYMYDPKTDIWFKKAICPVDLVGGTTLNGKAYVMDSGKNIWEYNAGNDTWIIKTKFPGIKYTGLLSFSYRNEIYFGFYGGYKNHSNLNDYRLWSYNIVSDKWQMLEKFPFIFTGDDFFNFFTKNNLYIGVVMRESTSSYTILKYDPSKFNGLTE